MDTKLFDYIRVLSERDTKTLSQKALKTVEEVGELAKKVLPYEGAFATNHRVVSREGIIEEVADVMLCVLSIAYDLGASHEDIAAMMSDKAACWSDLQSRDNGGKFPLPFEIHVTVRLDGDSATDGFRRACTEIGIKPIILDLQSKQGVSVMTDVMTSSKHYGSNTSALDEAQKICGQLMMRGFEVVRTKLESVPWHPAAPQRPSHKMPKDCYFESHIPVIIHPDETSKLSEAVGMLSLDVHVSRNAFKTLPDGNVVVMLTYRLYDGYAGRFKDEVDDIVLTLTDAGFNIGKVHTEFAVYDTKVSHDANWLK